MTSGSKAWTFVDQRFRVLPEVGIVQAAFAVPAVDGPADELGPDVPDQPHVVVPVEILPIAFGLSRDQEIRHRHGAVQVVLQHLARDRPVEMVVAGASGRRGQIRIQGDGFAGLDRHRCRFLAVADVAANRRCGCGFGPTGAYRPSTAYRPRIRRVPAGPGPSRWSIPWAGRAAG